jgi:hypothetical protein
MAAKPVYSFGCAPGTADQPVDVGTKHRGRVIERE